MRIRIQKRSEVQGGLPSRDALDHIPGRQQPPSFSLPLEYTAEGELLQDIKVGEPVFIARDDRNGVKAVGMFQTSIVTEVTDTTFRTKNSVYEYSFLTSELVPV